MLQRWLRTWHLPSFFVPTPGDLTAQESPPPWICHPRQKNANARGSARGGKGAGRRWNWLMHNFYHVECGDGRQPRILVDNFWIPRSKTRTCSTPRFHADIAVLLLFFALIPAFAFFLFKVKITVLVLWIFTSNISPHFAESTRCVKSTRNNTKKETRKITKF